MAKLEEHVMRRPVYRVYSAGDKKVPMWPGHVLIQLPPGDWDETFLAEMLGESIKLDDYYHAEGDQRMSKLLLENWELVKHVWVAMLTTLLMKYQLEHHSWYVEDENGERYTVQNGERVD